MTPELVWETVLQRTAHNRRRAPLPIVRCPLEGSAMPAPRGQKPPPNRHASSAGTNASWGTMGYPRGREASAPVRHLFQEGPDRPAERSREMRDRRIEGDNQIQVVHDRRGINENIRTGSEILARHDQSRRGSSCAKTSIIWMLTRRTPSIRARFVKQARGTERAGSVFTFGLPRQQMPILKPCDPIRAAHFCTKGVFARR